VVKVERPVAGDDTRHWGPPFLRDDAGNDTREASYFTACNRNKRSSPWTWPPRGPRPAAAHGARGRCGGGELQDRGLAQYGLDYASLKALNPRLVYCSITGFGQDGPYAERAGYDLMVQAMCGLMSITGHADGEPGGGPLKVGVAVIDVFTGLYASNAILAALNARHTTGQGQYIDMALLDVGMAVLANQAAGFLATGQAPGRAGNTHPSLAPYQDFPTLDGNVLWPLATTGSSPASAPPSNMPNGHRTSALPPTPPACKTAARCWR
jgi:crotonobetainyl-CoA:carnitine CoA-transferase CaiB-like acyl-CoA transferase